MIEWEGYRLDTDTGVVYGRRGRPVGYLNPDGYTIIDRRSHGAGQVFAHRMIWTAVNGPIPDGLEINHLNGVKTDNRLVNLEAVTRRENVLHAFRIGLKSTAGEKHPQHRLTDDLVRTLRARYVRYSRDANAAALAREFGLGRKCVADMLVGNTWRHVR